MNDYPADKRGSIERIDVYAPRNVERCFDQFWQGVDLRTLTVEKPTETPVLMVRGTGDDPVWWCPVPELAHYAFFAVKATRTLSQHHGHHVMVVACVVQEIDAGKQEEQRTIVTDFALPRPISGEEFDQGIRA